MCGFTIHGFECSHWILVETLAYEVNLDKLFTLLKLWSLIPTNSEGNLYYQILIAHFLLHLDIQMYFPVCANVVVLIYTEIYLRSVWEMKLLFSRKLQSWTIEAKCKRAIE